MLPRVVGALAVVVQVFDVGPARYKSHPRTTFNYLFTRREGPLGQAKRRIRVSVVIRLELHLRYACCSVGSPLVFPVVAFIIHSQ